MALKQLAKYLEVNKRETDEAMKIIDKNSELWHRRMKEVLTAI